MKLTIKTKVLVTGAGGMLGESVYERLKNKTTVCATSHKATDDFLIRLDVCNHRAVKEMVLNFKPDLVIHLAAITDLEYCEKHPYKAKQVNVTATKNLAKICEELAIPLVYISTGIIFNGSKKRYLESDIPNPSGVYAQTKYSGECEVAKLVTKHFIFRAGWLIGGGPLKDKKFVGKVMQQIQSGKKNLFAVTDRLGTITYAPDFVDQMLLVIQEDKYGTYHAVSNAICSRYDITNEIVRILQRPDITVNKITSDYFETKKQYTAKRPVSEGLSPKKLQKMNLYIMRDWKTCLAEYLTRWR